MVMHLSHPASVMLGLVNKLLSVSAADFHSEESLDRNVKNLTDDGAVRSSRLSVQCIFLSVQCILTTSLLPSNANVLGHLVCNCLSALLYRHKLLTPAQYGLICSQTFHVISAGGPY